MVVVRKGTKDQPDQVQLAKEAFLHDAAENCYWCPPGQRLSYTGTTSEMTKGTGRRVIRQRYRAEPSACESCPLRGKCLQGEEGTARTLSRDQYDDHREELRQRLSAEKSAIEKSAIEKSAIEKSAIEKSATEKSATEKSTTETSTTAKQFTHLGRRQTAGERPFAVVQQQMGLRQFLLRGLANVTKEWRWMTSSANMQVMIRWWRSHGNRLASSRRMSPTGPGARASPSPVGP